MTTIRLPYPQTDVDLSLVLACWVELTTLWRPAQPDPLATPMPVYSAHANLYVRLAENPLYAYSFDVLLRLCSPYRDTMQATPDFFTGTNAAWVNRSSFANGLPKADQSFTKVNCACLTDEAINYWKTLPADVRMQASQDAQALLEADVESDAGIVGIVPVQPAGYPVTDVIAGSESTVASTPMQSADLRLSVSGHALSERNAILKQLVDEIDAAPFERMYRRTSLGEPTITGWDKRLEAYFWPHPARGYSYTCDQLQGMLDDARVLAEKLDAAPNPETAWSPEEKETAVALANRIFVWGGVPQKPATVTAENVQRVFQNALDARAESTALMNSGWTKVAAFATAHLEQRHPDRTQVIWDSRVATSIIWRLDRILGSSLKQNPRDLFPCIGTVQGQGGTRPRQLLHAWPGGYRKWSAQISGSAIVREIRDILNRPDHGYPRMPLPDGSRTAWTTRGVEMVLFMDGY